ncbi:hypothetical protein ZWY2020_056786 [Hordeum vulgare]|nr:hypothetical protein ZWY2020_056786 [Hordeum vulgare]
MAAKIERREGGPRSNLVGGPLRASSPPPPPLPLRAETAEWPSFCIPRLERMTREEIQQHELYVVRRTQSTADQERRLQFAMVAYVGGSRHDIRPKFMLHALGSELGIEPEWLLVHHYRPEDFLVVFARQEHRNMVAERPFIESQGVRLFFQQWNRQAQAVHSELHFKVSLVLEGITLHAWEREVAEDLLGTSFPVDTVAPESSSLSVQTLGMDGEPGGHHFTQMADNS